MDYFWARGLTLFMQDYFGVGGAYSDTSQTTVTGAGTVFAGLGLGQWGQSRFGVQTGFLVIGPALTLRNDNGPPRNGTLSPALNFGMLHNRPSRGSWYARDYERSLSGYHRRYEQD